MDKYFIKRLALLPLILLNHYVFANNPSPLKGTAITTNIVYGQSLNHQGVQEGLDLDIYIPDNHQLKNPLIVFIHGGSFIEGSKEDLSNYCNYFAEKGFTAVTINYRKGWNTSTTSNSCEGDPESLKKAGYRAIQDCRAAIRFLVANATTYRIDPEKIFLAGESAGATTALSTAYMDQAECEVLIPNVSNELGLLDESGNDHDVTYTIKGVINMWGGILSPSIIQPSEKVPVLSFHGTNDMVTPYEVGYFNNCSNFMEVHGSKVIYDVLSARNVSTVLHELINGAHGVYSFDYRAANIHCFISRLLRNEAVTGRYNDHVDVCPPIILPVRFISFQVKQNGTSVSLQWQTAEEVNNKEFLVERSSNGSTFSTLATIPPNVESSINTYTYEDKTPLRGKSYYRIRQVDIDGGSTVSIIRTILISSFSELHIITNGHTASFYYQSPNNEPYTITDLQGRLIQRGRVSKNKTTISGLAAGAYFLQLSSESGPLYKRFVIYK
jgi:poly(3-hydroxybutyrate) depolymerase